MNWREFSDVWREIDKERCKFGRDNLKGIRLFQISNDGYNETRAYNIVDSDYRYGDLFCPFGTELDGVKTSYYAPLQMMPSFEWFKKNGRKQISEESSEIIRFAIRNARLFS